MLVDQVKQITIPGGNAVGVTWVFENRAVGQLQLGGRNR